MGKNKKNPEKKAILDQMVSEFDFSEGFGGIPENVSLTKNIGCASDSKPKGEKNSKK